VKELFMDSPIEGLECPHCGNNESFNIASFVFAPVDAFGVHLDGTEDYEWDRSSICSCRGCGYVSTVGKFTLILLDEDEDYSMFDEDDYE
jgi:hypothetical protein